ncbi:MAG: hypothetical protein WCF71_02585 [Verrucomicrobiia bacterium]
MSKIFFHAEEVGHVIQRRSNLEMICAFQFLGDSQTPLVKSQRGFVVAHSFIFPRQIAQRIRHIHVFLAERLFPNCEAPAKKLSRLSQIAQLIIQGGEFATQFSDVCAAAAQRSFCRIQLLFYLSNRIGQLGVALGFLVFECRACEVGSHGLCWQTVTRKHARQNYHKQQVNVLDAAHNLNFARLQKMVETTVGSAVI